MATVRENLRWKLFKIKRDVMFSYGIKHNKIFAYGPDFIEKLRDVYYGPIPLSIMFLISDFCDGKCYERAPLIVYGFLDDDFEVIDATINSLKYKPDLIDKYREGVYDENYGEHCFVIRKLEDGTEWVYDTSLGLIFDKDFYYTYERPEVRVQNDKEKTLWFISEECPGSDTLANDKYLLPVMLPSIENNMEPVQNFYLDNLKREIQVLKDKVDYDTLYKNFYGRKKKN